MQEIEIDKIIDNIINQVYCTVGYNETKNRHEFLSGAKVGLYIGVKNMLKEVEKYKLLMQNSKINNTLLVDELKTVANALEILEKYK